MDDETRRKIDDIIAGMSCPKAFRCAESGFERLCSAQDIGLDDYLVCLEDRPGTCSFALPFGGAHFCRCPLRVFLAKNVGPTAG
jgi:hypothetical protein